MEKLRQNFWRIGNDVFVVELNIRKNWRIVLYSKEKKDKEEKREINRYWEIKSN